MEKIPCLDLKLQHQSIIKDGILDKLLEVYNATAFSGGKFAEDFERVFAEFCRTRYAVAVNSGTSALHLAMLAIGVGSGDEVIVPANTFIATAWAVTYVGATPVFVDCDTDTWEIDPSRIDERVTPRTKAVIGVHLYGMPFDVEAVKLVTDTHGIFLVEDAAQAHGARYNGKSVGTFGEMGCFSFYPGKNLGACGEGGGIVTDNEEYYNHMLALRNHGCTERYHHDEVGFNMRMGGFEAASLTVKLGYLTSWNNRRKQIAKRYMSEISNPKIKSQRQPAEADSVYHLFVVTADDRDRFARHLEDSDIQPAFHYPVPCHLQKAYSGLGYKIGDCPNAEHLADHCVSLPMYAELTDEQVDRVIHAVNSY